jgi:hypothetical protein
MPVTHLQPGDKVRCDFYGRDVVIRPPPQNRSATLARLEGGLRLGALVDPMKSPPGN